MASMPGENDRILEYPPVQGRVTSERAVRTYDGATLPTPAAVIAEYEATIDNLANAVCGVIAHESTVEALREALANRKAALALDERIDGKNAEQRSAQLALLVQDDEQSQSIDASLVAAERELSLAQARITTLQARIRFHERVLGYLTAAVAVTNEASHASA